MQHSALAVHQCLTESIVFAFVLQSTCLEKDDYNYNTPVYKVFKRIIKEVKWKRKSRNKTTTKYKVPTNKKCTAEEEKNINHTNFTNDLK